MPNNTEIKIVEPSIKHYKAYLTACRKMCEYLADNQIIDPVGKRESRGFIFTQKDFHCDSVYDFDHKIVKFYEAKRENRGQDGSILKSMQKNSCPEYFYFVMNTDKLIGSVNARPQPRDKADIENNLRSYKKWEYLSPSGIRVTTSIVLLPEYRGKDLAQEINKQFFDKLRQYGIEEIAATVESDNPRSQKTQAKLMNSYGGKQYNFSGKNPETNEIKNYTRYIINTDTTGNSKYLYHNAETNTVKDNLKYISNKNNEGR